MPREVFFLHFGNTEHFYIVDNYECDKNSTKGMYCCVVVVTLVRRTLQDVTLEVLAYLVVSAVIVNATLVFSDSNFCLRTHAHACRSV